MEIIDSGVLPPSFMDFTLQSVFAKNALYYVPQFGHFYCNQDYCISRESLDQFLLVYVCAGTLSIETRDRSFSAGKDQLVLLDCHFPHRYYCEDAVEFLWFHFQGSSSAQYADYLYEQYGNVFSGGQIPSLRLSFERIFSYCQAIPSNEHLISLHIGQILCWLSTPEKQALAHHPTELAIQYIRKNFNQEITLEELSMLCSMSQSHFIRSFKGYIHSTPHEYLLAYRLRQAKYLLMNTPDTIEQIAEQCGFNSASHFARAFRKSNQISPTEFRSMHF